MSHALQVCCIGCSHHCDAVIVASSLPFEGVLDKALEDAGYALTPTTTASSIHRAASSCTSYDLRFAAAAGVCRNRRRRKGLFSASSTPTPQSAVNSRNSDIGRVTSYGSIEGHSLDRTTSLNSVASESPGSSCYSDQRNHEVPHCHLTCLVSIACYLATFLRAARMVCVLHAMLLRDIHVWHWCSLFILTWLHTFCRSFPRWSCLQLGRSIVRRAVAAAPAAVMAPALKQGPVSAGARQGSLFCAVLCPCSVVACLQPLSRWAPLSGLIKPCTSPAVPLKRIIWETSRCCCVTFEYVAIGIVYAF